MVDGGSMDSSKASKHSKAIKKNSVRPIPVSSVGSKQESNEDRLYQIAVSAYYKAEARGYDPGHEIQDWLEAEAEIDKSEQLKYSH